jgi:hypothetical protein
MPEMNIEELLAQKYQVDPQRDLLVPDRRFCRLNLTSVVDLKKRELASIDELDNFATLPSWSKVCAFPDKARAFFSTFFTGIGPGVSRLESLQLDWQITQQNLKPRHRFTCPKTGNSILVEMMFFNTKTNAQLNSIGKIYHDTMPNTVLIVLCGDRFNGTSYTNENAQKRVIKAIRKAAKEGRNVMILASRLGQRSFSVPALSTVYLCYDNGSESATRQKLARALTADTVDKVGWIVSCSFDPRSDDKLLPELVATAQNLRRKNGGSFADNLRYVIRSENIFDMTDDGLEVNDSDSWYNYAYESGMITRVLGAMSNPYQANSQLRNLLLGASSWTPQSNNSADPADTGETYKQGRPKQGTQSGDRTEEQIEAAEIAKLRAVLTLIVELFPRMQIGTGQRQVMAVLTAVKDSDDHRAWFQKRVNIPIDAVFMCIEQGVIKEENLEAMAG